MDAANETNAAPMERSPWNLAPYTTAADALAFVKDPKTTDADCAPIVAAFVADVDRTTRRRRSRHRVQPPHRRRGPRKPRSTRWTAARRCRFFP